MGTILYVHGTGVRLPSYKPDFENAKRLARSVGIQDEFVPCAWGDPLGAVFHGKSVPGGRDPSASEAERRDVARWTWLFDDPLFELQQLTIHDSEAPVEIPPPGVRTPGEEAWDKIANYQPSPELRLLLQRGELGDAWSRAWKSIVDDSAIPKAAFEASSHELAEVSDALARALVAQMHVLAIEDGKPGPAGALRRMIVARLLEDWGQLTLGFGAFFLQKLFERFGTTWVRANRGWLSDWSALKVGDVLLYQSRGAEVRAFIREKIAAARPPVTLVAHSLGGIACVDLLAMKDPPKIARLVTAGSQSPFLYELGGLASLKFGAPLPEGFPRWLNFWDPNDFLSYMASPFWPTVQDREVHSEQPFPDSHGAYFGNEQVWTDIRDFIQ